MSLANVFVSKRGLVLSALLVCAVIFELADCEKDVHKQRSTTAKTKPKLVKSPNKRPKAQNKARTQAVLTQVLKKGKFKKVGETLSVLTGDTLELRCRGKRVQWRVPTYLQEDHDGRLKTVQQERYGVLRVVNSTGADTGEYACYPLYCEDADCRREYDKAARVFVFFPDPQDLFVPSSDHYEVIQLRTNWPTLLPCQVTSPEAKVTLHREFPPAEVAVDGTDISFNVMKGFTIHRPRPHHAGAMYCVASLGGLRQSSTKYMLIYVHYPMAPPAPVIQASAGSVAIGREPARQLLCGGGAGCGGGVQLGIPRTVDWEAFVHTREHQSSGRRTSSPEVPVCAPGG
ncbi:hypothetical protein fugu_013353 [Takifugu bimaculatus]|uniref:Platelet-derived growth factor receptor-like protein n=1 Tax=Takifugu bimaculatus TaxID=433685 RepID=A0A4Z2C2Z8_9TELE|nr:hypothetical protein fugu_013353 [Takifugu bimaculatus]